MGETGEPKEQYLTNIAWSPDEKDIYIVILNRDQNHFMMNRYDAASGEFEKTLFEEKHDKYVQPLHKMEFIPTNDGLFIWQSRRDNYNHFYLYSTEGKLIRQITKGNWEVSDFIGFDEKGRKVFFRAADETAMNKYMYTIGLSGGKMKKIGTDEGSHYGIISGTGEYVADHFSSTRVPRKTTIYTADGKMVMELNAADNPLSDYAMADMSFGTIKAADGVTDLTYRLYKPVNMEAGKKYPVIVYVYGGPGVQIISNRWLGSGNLWYHLLAQKGYVVFTLENRGTPLRGREFEQATFRKLGTEEVADQVKGAEYLKTLDFVDPERIGVHGWSYGGYMTTSLMTRTPGVFKVGVAGGPVIDWDYYEVMYTERFMDTPDRNEEGYKNSNLRNYVEDLEGRLLIIHGTDDDVVVWQHSVAYVKEAIEKGVLIDYFVYPGHPHNVYGKDRIHLLNKITQFFDDHL